ncbi:MAG TPA: SRPBCC domain-containing protein [Candidatus Udaeobacter sp.]|nr:SRPBCC domain-containing protein [Candidatus Udaeobacter sp.]
MIEPLHISFVVECSAEHAFDTWTSRATSWWPPEHTVSHQRDATIVFEPQPGGRIFERTQDGVEFDWGEIVEWEPPRRLRYLWHIATDPANATDVEIVFHPLSRSRTRVEIEHGGWERLGDHGPAWREANHAGWDGVLPFYEDATRN